MAQALVLILATLVAYVQSASSEVRVLLQDGCVSGITRTAENTTEFASFLGVPYAKQPIGEQRFSELEPLDPWDDCYNASAEGPPCYQYDTLYGSLLPTTNMSESCIYANIHVPLHALPEYNTTTAQNETEQSGLPIFVFIHGGGFAFGSGGAAMHGPEYLITKDIIVITFNYRLNVFGFLSLNSTTIPGNNGLRDMVTLLKWVQANAKSFGGDPDNVTLAGQSAGSCSAHLLSLSSATKGLFKRVMLMSGTAIPSFYTTSPVHAKAVADLFLAGVGINATDPDEIHSQLIAMPIEKIMEVNKQVQVKFGLVSFYPVVETPVSGFTTILNDDPETLLSNGVGKDIPLLIGFANGECEIIKPVFEQTKVLDALKDNAFLLLSPNLIYKLGSNVADAVSVVEARYFGDDPTVDEYTISCSDTNYIYPTIKVANTRALTGGASVFLYQFSYSADFSAIKISKNVTTDFAVHINDQEFVLKTNIMEGTTGFSPRTLNDQSMIDKMTTYVKNFISCNDPTCGNGTWLAVGDQTPAPYLNIKTPGTNSFENQTTYLQSMVNFFDNILNSTLYQVDES